jgi:hypothetical protein
VHIDCITVCPKWDLLQEAEVRKASLRSIEKLSRQVAIREKLLDFLGSFTPRFNEMLRDQDSGAAAAAVDLFLTLFNEFVLDTCLAS